MGKFVLPPLTKGHVPRNSDYLGKFGSSVKFTGNYYDNVKMDPYHGGGCAFSEVTGCRYPHDTAAGVMCCNQKVYKRSYCVMHFVSCHDLETTAKYNKSTASWLKWYEKGTKESGRVPDDKPSGTDTSD